MVKNTVNNKKLLDLASNFSEFIERHSWVPRYDVESDSLSITAPKLHKDARIRYFDNEIAFYITKNGKVEGVFVEYFSSNFLKHHRTTKKFLDELKSIQKRTPKTKSLVEISREKIKQISNNLEEAIKIALAQRLELKFQN